MISQSTQSRGRMTYLSLLVVKAAARHFDIWFRLTTGHINSRGAGKYWTYIAVACAYAHAQNLPAHNLLAPRITGFALHETLAHNLPE